MMAEEPRSEKIYRKIFCGYGSIIYFWVILSLLSRYGRMVLAHIYEDGGNYLGVALGN